MLIRALTSFTSFTSFTILQNKGAKVFSFMLFANGNPGSFSAGCVLRLAKVLRILGVDEKIAAAGHHMIVKVDI
jgi:hypothetical protein